MNDQLLVLNALLRLARRRVPASFYELDARVGASAPRVRSALSGLAAAGLVQRGGGPGIVARLTFEGFALAVAMAKTTASRRAQKPVARLGRRAA